jgi:hypothetical protein
MTPAAVWLEVYTRQRRTDPQFVLPWEPTPTEQLRAAIADPDSAFADQERVFPLLGFTTAA